MYRKEGGAEVFRLRSIADSASTRAGLMLVCVLGLTSAYSAWDGWQHLPSSNSLITWITWTGRWLISIVLLSWATWLFIRPFVQKAVALRVSSDGIGTYSLHDRTIPWADLRDITIVSSAYGDPTPYVLRVALKLKENSPSLVAIQRKWAFRRRDGVGIPISDLPGEEQIQAVLALLVAFAQYRDERMASSVQGISRDRMKQSLRDLLKPKRTFFSSRRSFEISELLRQMVSSHSLDDEQDAKF